MGQDVPRLRLWGVRVFVAMGNKGLNLETRRYLFAGRVQGVGFRYTCQRVSGRFDVAGWVRNLSDGTVEVVAQGNGQDLAAFVNGIQSEIGRSTFGRIDEVQVEEIKQPVECHGFAIR